nr:syntaxin-related protein KNOLLE [Tanacetum cinerariifolium]
MRIMPAGKGAKAHGEVGRGVLVLFRCRCVYRRGLGKRWSFWRENSRGCAHSPVTTPQGEVAGELRRYTQQCNPEDVRVLVDGPNTSSFTAKAGKKGLISRGTQPIGKVLTQAVRFGGGYRCASGKEHCRGKVLETVVETQDHYDAAKEIEMSLLKLQQVFLDMAVMVEAQAFWLLPVLANREVHTGLGKCCQTNVLLPYLCLYRCDPLHFTYMRPKSGRNGGAKAGVVQRRDKCQRRTVSMLAPLQPATPYSGITKEMMDGLTTTLRDVQYIFGNLMEAFIRGLQSGRFLKELMDGISSTLEDLIGRSESFDMMNAKR